MFCNRKHENEDVCLIFEKQAAVSSLVLPAPPYTVHPYIHTREYHLLGCERCDAGLVEDQERITARKAWLAKPLVPQRRF